MASIAVLGLIMFVTNTAAAKLLDPTTLSFFKAPQLVLSVISQIFFFKNIPSLTTGAGSSLVVIAVIIKGAQNKLEDILPNGFVKTLCFADKYCSENDATSESIEIGRHWDWEELNQVI